MTYLFCQKMYYIYIINQIKNLKMKKLILLTIAIFTTCLVNAQVPVVKYSYDGGTTSTPITSTPSTVTVTSSFANSNSALSVVYYQTGTPGPWILRVQRASIVYTIFDSTTINNTSNVSMFQEVINLLGSIQNGDKITVSASPTGYSKRTVIFNISNGVATGINDHTTSNSYKSYPNPVINTLYIDFPKDQKEGKSEIEIFNISGQLIYNEKVENTIEKATIETSNYAAGIYIVRIGNYTQKFVKQ